MRIKKLIIKLGVILLLFGSVACKNKNTELEKKIANLEKQNAELAKRQQEQQNLVSIKTNEIKKKKRQKYLQNLKKFQIMKENWKTGWQITKQEEIK